LSTGAGEGLIYSAQTDFSALAQREGGSAGGAGQVAWRVRGGGPGLVIHQRAEVVGASQSHGIDFPGTKLHRDCAGKVVVLQKP
jgi:hypothetical protein